MLINTGMYLNSIGKYKIQIYNYYTTHCTVLKWKGNMDGLNTSYISTLVVTVR